MLHRCFLIRQSLVAVFQINDAAILKTAFEKCALHGEIVAVGVDAQILTFLKAFVNAKADNSPPLLGNRNAVNDTVGLVR